MKAFKINSQVLVAVITASLSLSIKNKASRKERGEIIKGLQRTMFNNRKKYGVDVLERNKFLFDGLMYLKSIETTDDVSFLEEVEIDIETIKLKEDSDAPKSLGELLAKLRASIEKESKPESPKSSDENIDKKGNASDKEDCDYPFCTMRKALS